MGFQQQRARQVEATVIQFCRMPTALMPDGQTRFVQNPLELSISVPGSDTRSSMERTLRQGLADDPRQLFVRVQGGGGYGPWCFWIQWGQEKNCCRTPAVLLGADEHAPEAILLRIRAELANLQVKDKQVQ